MFTQQQVNMMDQAGQMQLLDLPIITLTQRVELKQQVYFLVVHLIQQGCKL